MTRESPFTVHRRGIVIAGAVVLAAVMWYAAARQLTGGLLDVAVFAPPGAALGVTGTWGAHVLAPKRFTWRRALIGVVAGGMIVGPIIAFLVAFTAAWNPAAFHFVFSAGAWVALAGGLAVGGIVWIVTKIGKRLHRT